MMKPKKSKRKIIAAAAAAVMLLLVLGAASVSIQTVSVTGNNHYTKAQIEELLFKDRWDRNPIYCFYRYRFQEHEEIPFVEDYKIVFQNPTSVEVIVYEKTVVGYVTYMGSCMYFDKDGIIVESSGERLEGIPLVTGLKFGHIVLHQRLPVEDEKIFSQILNLTQLLSTYGISVDKIQYDSHGNATLLMGDIDVYLGGNDQMSGKIAELKDQLPVLAGLSGTLYLDTYDEAETATSYRFIKKK